MRAGTRHNVLGWTSTPPADDPRRVAVREWIAEHPSPSGAELAQAGYVAPHWPRPWGVDADAIHQVLIDDELTAAGVRRPVNPIGIGWAGPTILYAGTKEQKAATSGRSSAARSSGASCSPSPAAGATSPTSARGPSSMATSSSSTARRSGRAAPSTPASASSSPAPTPAAQAQGHLLLRVPDGWPGIEIRPITEMTGGHTFNESFSPTSASRRPTLSATGATDGVWPR